MRNYIQFILLVQVITWLSILLDVSTLRQVFGFLFITFIPGYVIVKALKIESQTIDTLLLSVGLSLAVVMLVGLAMSTLSPFFGLANPLSLFPLVLVISCFVSCVLLIACRSDLTSAGPQVNDKPGPLTIFHVSLFVIPVLGIVGSVLNNVFILLIMIVAMAVFYLFGYSSRIAPTKYHILIILVISLALIFHMALISKYIMGEDMHIEVYVFRQTQIRGYWVSPGVGVNTDIARFGSVLSITILPTVYSAVLGCGMETIFKIVFLLVFALVPLVLYRIYETQTNKTIAFLSVLFFMASATFFGLEPLTLARQIIAELLMVLSIFLLFEKKIATERKKIPLIILGAGLIVSHYALAYLYVFLVILAYVVLRKWRSKDVLSAPFVLLLFSMTFGWYVYVSDAPLMKVSDDIQRIQRNFMNDVVSPAARSSQVATLVSAPSTIVSVINRIVSLATIFLIVVGVVALVLKGRKSDLDSKYRLMSLAALIIMIACVVLPDVAGTFNLTRFYGMTMIFLAPFFVLGGQTILTWTKRAISPLSAKISRLHRLTNDRMLGLQLISILLVASFLFNTGFVEHVTGVYPQSSSLDKDQKRMSKDINIRTSYYTEVPAEQDVISTTWLSKHLDDDGIVYNGDPCGIWYSYGLLSPDRQGWIYAFTGTQKDSYAYLSYANTVGGLLNNTVMSPALTSSNKIYADGACEIYSTAG
jgi:uncharacterized membrane protein